jgi:hypothetical protein
MLPKVIEPRGGEGHAHNKARLTVSIQHHSRLITYTQAREVKQLRSYARWAYCLHDKCSS